MRFEIVEISDFAGGKATIYAISIDGGETNSYDRFIDENVDGYEVEIRDIDQRLTNISEIGARIGFFKPDEGKPGDGVCALYDSPDSHLRLYCIRYGNVAIILGGGGPKPKSIRAWQENKKLNDEARDMIMISAAIRKRMEDSELKWSADGRYLTGNLKFYDDEE